MHVFFFGFAAIALYLATAARVSLGTTAGGASHAPRPLLAALAGSAIVSHGLALYPMMVTPDGINLGIFSASSLVAWLIATIAIGTNWRQPVDSLAVVILPFCALVVGLSLGFHHPHVLAATPPGLALHIALSLVAYALFAIAALQAGYLAFAAHRLKSHTPVLRFLPPLATMEQLLFQLTALAFVLLSVGLVIGTLYIHDVREQHLGHKIVFSGMAWATFAALLLGRHLGRWRGRRAAKFVITGFVLLALGFFGSKIVLELILGRT